jgi:AraC family transcriptional regulator, transcriptional activator of pobA
MHATETFIKRSDRSRANEIPRYGGGKDFSFSIRALLDPEMQEHSIDKPHRHPYFEIIWIVDGEGSCSIDLERHTVNNNTIYFVPPGHIHSLQCGENSRGYILSFSREFIHLASGTVGNSFYNDMLMDSSGSFGIEKGQEKADMENILCCIQKEFGNYSLLRSEILSGWLRIFLCYLKGLSKTRNGKSDQTKNIELVNHFYASLERDFLKKKMVIDYANELFISPNYLNEIVKRVSGFTASHHIQQRIVLEAKRLAIYTSSSMKEIAYFLGFEDIAYFSKFFKTFSGGNFRDFKRSRSLCEASE